MKTEQCKFIKWVNAHKKELIIAGVSISTVVAIIFACKNRNELHTLMNALKGQLDNRRHFRSPFRSSRTVNTPNVGPDMGFPKLKPCVISNVPQEIKSHIRNLPKGWNASAEKLATAAEKGYLLLPGQTWVDSYTRNRISA